MKQLPKPTDKHPAKNTGDVEHTYALWMKASSAEHAAIVARAAELMNMIAARHLGA